MPRISNSDVLQAFDKLCKKANTGPAQDMRDVGEWQLDKNADGFLIEKVEKGNAVTHPFGDERYDAKTMYHMLTFGYAMYKMALTHPKNR